MVARPAWWEQRFLSTDDLFFPKFNYYLDESDPDIVILRCQDGSFVAPFSPDGVTKDGIIEAAKEDYWEHISIIGPGEASVPLRNSATLNFPPRLIHPTT